MKRILILVLITICGSAYAETAIMNAFSAGEITPRLFGRTDAQNFYSGARVLENMFVWPHGPVEKRRGTYFVAEVGVTETIPGTPAVSATYTTTYISANNTLYGIPVGDTEMLGGLDSAGVAVDLGAGLVGLPYTGHPFAAGETVIISNTTSYNASEVLHGNTSANQLVVTSAYNAETFDGTELVIQTIASLGSGAGRSAMDGAGNIYFGHNWSVANNTYITKIETDGTLVYNYLDMSSAPAGGDTSGTVRGLAITPDGNYLYIVVEENGPTDHGYVYKWDLTDGSEVWVTVYDGATAPFLAWPQYDLDVDADGNCYITNLAVNRAITKIGSDGVTMSKMLLMGEKKEANISTSFPSVAVVDNGMGIVITGGSQFAGTGFGYPDSSFYNLAVRTFDDSAGDQLLVGPTYEAAGATTTYSPTNASIVTLDGVIYVLMATPTLTIYKISWNGTSLAHVSNVAAPADALGMYVDLYGNIVVINQNTSVPVTDVLHFYDSDLNAIGSIDGFNNTTLRGWDAAVGGSWQKGNATFNGILGSAGTPATNVAADSSGDNPPARLVSFPLSAGHGRIIVMTDGYFSFCKDVP